MSPRLLGFVAEVIRESSQTSPADEVLRRKLKVATGLAGRDGSEASRAVFAYYRWLGWLDPKQVIGVQIERALELAAAFRKKPETFSDQEILERTVPGWVAEEMKITSPWARALQSEPRLWLRARPGRGTELAKRLRNSRQFREGSEIVEYLGRDDLFATAEFHAGEFEIQDISSQAVGLLCAPEPGQTWWDACAGEGGKLLHLADLMANKGLIWASDRAAWRLARLKRRAARAKLFNYRSRLWDGGARLPVKTLFDGALVDAPCSGVGTWQRNPHARWTTTQNDVRELSQIQKALLEHAAAAVKPGGRLIYAVCSLTRAETLEVRDAFEKGRPEFERLRWTNPLKEKSPPGEEIWLWPQECGGNGMFVAGWRRRGSA
jgi:16S rRNA (cytosine967-C5)-methyltransferase